MNSVNTHFRSDGFTLIELIVTLAVTAILLGVAVPSFLSVVHNNRIASQTNTLVAALNLARTEAIKRRAVATVCISSNASTCTGSDWSTGWLVWVDDNGDGSMQTAERLRVFDSTVGSMTVTEAGSSTNVVYNTRGFNAAGVTRTFVLNADHCAGGSARTVMVGPSGSPNTASTSC